MLFNLANSRVGIKMARMMITPPMVGVPAFRFSPDKPSSLMVSPICNRLKELMIRLPSNKDINKDKIIAAAERNVIYLNNPAPTRS